MKFEKQFPSLKGYIDLEDIQKHCLDKAKVRKAIDKIRRRIPFKDMGFPLTLFCDDLKKELGLEKKDDNTTKTT